MTHSYSHAVHETARTLKDYLPCRLIQPASYSLLAISMQANWRP